MQGLLLLAALLAHDDASARDRFQNPKDLEGYIAAQEAPSRAAWQKPEEILDALALVSEPKILPYQYFIVLITR